MDPTPAAAFAGIEAGSVTGNIYQNPSLGLSFPIPAGLVAASFPSLHALNDRLEVSARSTILGPGVASDGALHPTAPKFIFYASRRGEWDGRQINLPSVSISALPARSAPLDLESFKLTAAQAAAISGMKLMGNVSNFPVRNHNFFRADFERGIGALRVYQTLVETLAGGFLLEIEINAYSQEELQQVASLLDSVSITFEK